MHNWFDQFVKGVLHEAFGPLGTAQQEVEVSTDAQRIDFFFQPGPKGAARPPSETGSAPASVPAEEKPAEVAEIPAIFTRMARTACLLEHYRRPPDARGVRGCLRKLLAQLHVDDMAAADSAHRPGLRPRPGAARRKRPAKPATATSKSAPISWVLSSGRPAHVVSGFSLRRLRGWPTDTYQGPLPALPYRMIVLNELPESRYTLPLRPRSAALHRSEGDRGRLDLPRQRRHETDP